METRPCPAVYEGACGGRPCARFESNSGAPWLPEVFDMLQARCSDRTSHVPHPVLESALGIFWCTAE
jgi:hypothetical protein